MNKAVSVFLFIVAGVAFFGAMSNIFVRMHFGRSPEAGVIFAGLLVGSLCIWGGLKMWRKE